MLNIILPLATLQLYERHIEKLKKLYPTALHLVALAVQKARGEELARPRLKFASDVAAGNEGPEFWDSKLWVACMHAFVPDNALARAWIASGSRPSTMPTRRHRGCNGRV